MRLMKKGTLTLFLLLAISIPLSAQYVVQGVGFEVKASVASGSSSFGRVF